MTRQSRDRFDEQQDIATLAGTKAMPASGEITIGDLTLDAMTAQTVRETARPPAEKGWVSIQQFTEAFQLPRNRGYETMKKLVAAGKWEATGGGNKVRYRPIVNKGKK